MSFIIGGIFYLFISRSPRKNVILEILPDNSFKLHKRKSFEKPLVNIKKKDGDPEAFEVNPDAIYNYFPNKRLMFVKTGNPAPLKVDFSRDLVGFNAMTSENLLSLVNSAHVNKVASGKAPKMTAIEIGIGAMVLIILIINVLIASKIFEVIK